ncbi:MAG: anthranilate phosphoribosyltransferase [Candidatus Omnitrophica bacterium CG11_big_fil_rev_8_21_14_0_20_42_13]|uniref:Anthranilate phosphoribosyltransferase n=1 Tax=Candidatus Ghiorseimicrobium undicola TaxID=1974746 RepID=A0A2H0LZE3_9BACT|nr:MAG: anthranilate phosphoribosyltransferase [Candidatus Omnitrophica bacterium CG11_big_fil_rev_8_21_14_0_20_42_13]
MNKISELTDFLNKGGIADKNQIQEAFDGIMSGKVETEDLKKFLLALKDRETPEIIAGAASSMRQAMIKINVRDYPEEIVLDTCGTGGSLFHTFNISTVAAFVIAGCGIKVAKHGNRAVSSKFGSADVLKELGLNLEISPKKVEEIIKEIGIGFMFAPLYHPAMKYAAQARKEIAARTIFNILGPLCNPAGADTQIVGVYEERLSDIIARALGELGSKRAFVIYSARGLDEVSIEGQTSVVELKEGNVNPACQVSPSDFGVNEAGLGNITPGNNSSENAKIILDILKGEESHRRDAVLINAALGIVAAGKTGDFKQAKGIGEESLASGNALKKLELLIERSRQ